MLWECWYCLAGLRAALVTVYLEVFLTEAFHIAQYPFHINWNFCTRSWLHFATPPTVCPRNDVWEVSQAARPIRSTTQIWVVTRHQYGVSALVSQTSFRGETVSGVAKCCLFSQANSPRISKRCSKLIPSERRYYLIYSWHLLVFLKQNSITYLNYKLEI